MSQDISHRRKAEILLVEDSTADVMLTKECFRRSGFPATIHRVENGEQCLSFLRKQDEYEGTPMPDLILLDLTMPVMDGREAMAEMVKDPRFVHLPVVVLSTSDHERDVMDMYRLRCNAYVRKPVDVGEFRETMEKLLGHWFTVVVLPPGDAGDAPDASDGSATS